MTKIVGLTGGIGSGKSTVARLLHKKGAAVIDTDRLAHEVYLPGTAAWSEIVEAFGRQVLTPDGKIDRGVLGGIVFHDGAALNKLNAITHPQILNKLQELFEEYREKNVSLIIVEAPLLIEAGWEKLVGEVWVVTAPDVKIAGRLKNQRGLNKHEIASRTNTRLPQVELTKRANVVINNDGSREHLKKQVTEQWDRLLLAR